MDNPLIVWFRTIKSANATHANLDSAADRHYKLTQYGRRKLTRLPEFSNGPGLRRVFSIATHQFRHRLLGPGLVVGLHDHPIGPVYGGQVGHPGRLNRDYAAVAAFRFIFTLGGARCTLPLDWAAPKGFMPCLAKRFLTENPVIIGITYILSILPIFVSPVKHASSFSPYPALLGIDGPMETPRPRAPACGGCGKRCGTRPSSRQRPWGWPSRLGSLSRPSSWDFMNPRFMPGARRPGMRPAGARPRRHRRLKTPCLSANWPRRNHLKNYVQYRCYECYLPTRQRKI